VLIQNHHDGERFSRVERVKLIANWPTALASLRVCLGETKEFEDGQLNCGSCPKCLRTKLELMCAGKLEEASTMPGGEPSAQAIRSGFVVEPETISFISTLKNALKKVGRKDLARAVTYREWVFYLSQATNLKEHAKRIDKVVLNGALKRKYKSVS